MIIKKFQGKTENEAVESAKKELGNNVVIMNVRNMKRKGLFGFLKKQMVEVTVALEEESERYPVVRKEERREPAAEQKQTQPLVEAIAKEMPKEPAGKDNSAIEEKLDSLHVLLEQQLQKPEEPKEKEQPAPEEEKKPDEMERFVKLLYNTMLDNEVNEVYANQVIDEMEKSNKPGMPFDYALANVYQKMILKFGKPSEITLSGNGPKVVFFVGPTGVGKTTTIAKIASKFRVEAGKKVALLTADTYRIAAAEQLRTYANILEVPFRVIYSAEEVSQALKDFHDFDLIMVDTAGHSHHNETQKETMKEFIRSVDEKVDKEVYLVLSATTKYKDLLSIVDAYKVVADYKLIFTKLDETTTLGNLLNVKLYTGADLSYVTYGQNVPDDIERFNPQKTVKQLLGGKK
ncbi:MAG: flagellar biosynthesis protein FlhF [Lachnospiraceae bacterium]|nr:flagellar biosynthesis protein FlhF [Lachnospiraceae bacterium]